MDRRRAALPVGASACVALLLSGCGFSQGQEQDAAVAPSVSVPAELPPTFADQGRWAMRIAADSAAVEMPEGVAVLLPGRTAPGLYRVAVLSAKDGAIRWVSDDFDAPVADSPPNVSATADRGNAWVLATTQVKANQVRVDVYAPAGTGDRREPAVSTVLTGSGKSVVPVVKVLGEGVVVSTDGGDTFQRFDPATGETLDYGGPGKVRAAWAEGVVVTGPSDAAGFGFVVRDQIVWQSIDARPAGAASDAKGTLLAVGDGKVLARWQGRDGKPMLAVHEIRSGTVLAALSGLESESIEKTRGARLVSSSDGAWVAWGNYLFGVKGDSSSVVDLADGHVTAIYRDVLYVADAHHALTASAAAVDDGGGGASGAAPMAAAAGSGALSGSFGAMVDAGTGYPLTNVSPEAVPRFVSQVSQGVFVMSTNGATRVYSVPLS